MGFPYKRIRSAFVSKRTPTFKNYPKIKFNTIGLHMFSEFWKTANTYYITIVTCDNIFPFNPKFYKIFSKISICITLRWISFMSQGSRKLVTVHFHKKWNKKDYRRQYKPDLPQPLYNLFSTLFRKEVKKQPEPEHGLCERIRNGHESDLDFSVQVFIQ